MITELLLLKLPKLLSLSRERNKYSLSSETVAHARTHASSSRLRRDKETPFRFDMNESIKVCNHDSSYKNSPCFRARDRNQSNRLGPKGSANDLLPISLTASAVITSTEGIELIDARRRFALKRTIAARKMFLRSRVDWQVS